MIKKKYIMKDEKSSTIIKYFPDKLDLKQSSIILDNALRVLNHKRILIDNG